MQADVPLYLLSLETARRRVCTLLMVMQYSHRSRRHAMEFRPRMSMNNEANALIQKNLFLAAVGLRLGTRVGSFFGNGLIALRPDAAGLASAPCLLPSSAIFSPFALSSLAFTVDKGRFADDLSPDVALVTGGEAIDDAGTLAGAISSSCVAGSTESAAIGDVTIPISSSAGCAASLAG